MITTEHKQKLINSLKKTGSGSPFLKDVSLFIESYDGTNEKDLDKMVFSAVLLLLSMNELEIKAKGFEEIFEANEEFKTRFNKIKEDYINLKGGVLPDLPPIPAK